MAEEVPCAACRAIAVAVLDPDIKPLHVRILGALHGMTDQPTARELAVILSVPFGPYFRSHVAGLAMRGLILRDASYPARLRAATTSAPPPAVVALRKQPKIATKRPARPKAPAKVRRPQTDEQRAFFGFFGKLSKLHSEIRSGAVCPANKTVHTALRHLWTANDRNDDLILDAYRAYLEDWQNAGSDASYGKGSPIDFAKNFDRYKDSNTWTAQESLDAWKYDPRRIAYQPPD